MMASKTVTTFLKQFLADAQYDVPVIAIYNTSAKYNQQHC
jgi:hypothetical protein